MLPFARVAGETCVFTYALRSVSVPSLRNSACCVLRRSPLYEARPSHTPGSCAVVNFSVHRIWQHCPPLAGSPRTISCTLSADNGSDHVCLERLFFSFVGAPGGGVSPVVVDVRSLNRGVERSLSSCRCLASSLFLSRSGEEEGGLKIQAALFATCFSIYLSCGVCGGVCAASAAASCCLLMIIGDDLDCWWCRFFFGGIEARSCL